MEKLASACKSFLIVAVCEITGPVGRHRGAPSQLGGPHHFPPKTPHQQCNCLPGCFPSSPAGRQRAQKGMAMWHSVSILSQVPGWGVGFRDEGPQHHFQISSCSLPGHSWEQKDLEHSTLLPAFLQGLLDPVYFIWLPLWFPLKCVCKGEKRNFNE